MQSQRPCNAIEGTSVWRLLILSLIPKGCLASLLAFHQPKGLHASTSFTSTLSLLFSPLWPTKSLQSRMGEPSTTLRLKRRYKYCDAPTTPGRGLLLINNEAQHINPSQPHKFTYYGEQRLVTRFDDSIVPAQQVFVQLMTWLSSR
jgi:hypothetical protein